jgi:hypothetical protein
MAFEVQKLTTVSVSAALLITLFACRSRNAPETDSSSASYIGAESCASCHAEAAGKWRQSHHALAMQQAADSTVLGDFRGVTFTKDGVTSTFTMKDGSRYVRTDGPEGKPGDYPVKYTFGVTPLQQYLVEFPNGRLQSLGIAWDSRDAGQGGQQWIHLYPDQKVPHTDPLHWTGRNQNWNFMCAECHSTNLQRNYDLAKDSYATTWSEINVSCESCHGPGSRHQAWAQAGAKAEDTSKGLVVQLNSSSGGWRSEESTNGTTRWKDPGHAQTQVETCAPCHSRRYPIKTGHQPGDPFLDGYAPSLLDEGVYFADGQIQEEDYEYGSFLQSRMYRQGVTCSDCHDPHSLSLRSRDLNGVCSQCHQPETFDTPRHHRHAS